jgi:hypothetical protein
MSAAPIFCSMLFRRLFLYIVRPVFFRSRSCFLWQKSRFCRLFLQVFASLRASIYRDLQRRLRESPMRAQPAAGIWEAAADRGAPPQASLANNTTLTTASPSSNAGVKAPTQP